MSKPTISIIILILVFIGGIGVFLILQKPAEEGISPTEEPVGVLEEETKPKMLDTDGDGVPDNEDDYPTSRSFIAKLEVTTKVNWYWTSGGYPRLIIFFEYRNNKPYNLGWVQPYATLKRADGTIIGTYSSLDDVEDIIFAPGEKCYALVEFDDYEKLTASVEPEVKGGPVQPGTKELKVEIVSHKGELKQVSGHTVYKISGIIKNSGEETEDIAIYAGIFATDGTLLDVQEGFVPISTPQGVRKGNIDIPPGSTVQFETFPLFYINLSPYDVNQISTYNLCITR